MISSATSIQTLLLQTPECEEFLYPFRHLIDEQTTIASLSQLLAINSSVLEYGLARTVKRAQQHTFDYQQMRSKLIKPDHVNIAGFVNFLWHREFVTTMKTKADELGIKLNINLFPKHSKKQFQNYISVCTSAEDLPEILIGKGFSSFMSQRFVDNFIKTGAYTHPSLYEEMSEVFAEAGLKDVQDNYHVFGVEESVMVLDKTLPLASEPPATWHSLLDGRYRDSIMQMGKHQRDHFGFNIMLYFYKHYGEAGIRDYAANVKNKQHFSYIIKQMATGNRDSAPINIVHQFASQFIRSDALQDTQIITTADGNPCVTLFFLMKKELSDAAITMAKHIYSEEVKKVMERCGTSHITSAQTTSNTSKLQWVGWPTVKELPLPYLKEALSDVAYNHYKKEQL